MRSIPLPSQKNAIFSLYIDPSNKKTDQVKRRVSKINQMKEYVSKIDQLQLKRIAVDLYIYILNERVPLIDF